MRASFRLPYQIGHGGRFGAVGSRYISDTATITATVPAPRRFHRPHRSLEYCTRIASEIDGVGTGMLEDFCAGKADLGVEALQAFTKVLYPHAEYDPEQDVLRSTNRQIVQAYAANYPPPMGDPKLLPSYSGPRPPGQPGLTLPPSPPLIKWAGRV